MHDDKFSHGARGEFRGDFTRDTFDPLRHVSRVLMQQGRVQLDADWNEQVSILMHHMRSVVRDIGSEHWGPFNDDERGFEISLVDSKLEIGKGRYYVKGLLCENEINEFPFNEQEGYPFTRVPNIDNLENGSYLVYLDVWERHLSYVEDDYMREKALGGPDTASRSQIVWQVKLKKFSSNDTADGNDQEFKTNYQAFLTELGDDIITPGSCKLRARARKNDDDKEPCLTSPDSHYRGAENQLYRVEIHEGSVAGGTATFKWSRENGSVIYPIKNVKNTIVTLENLGRDSRFTLKPNDWVEVVDDDYILQNRADSLLQVLEIDPENIQVKLSGPPTITMDENINKHPYLRRWDHNEKSGGLLNGALKVTASGVEDDKWLDLENGVQIQFSLPVENGSESHIYHTGDYWLIPARTSTGDVEWPGSVDDPLLLSPHGVIHHYAPLALTTYDGGTLSSPVGLRRKLTKNWE